MLRAMTTTDHTLVHRVTVPLDGTSIDLGCLCRVGHNHMLDDTKDD